MKLRDRQYRSRYDRRDNGKRIIPEYEREPIDFRRVMFKWGPWAALAAACYWAVDTFVI